MRGKKVASASGRKWTLTVAPDGATLRKWGRVVGRYRHAHVGVAALCQSAHPEPVVLSDAAPPARYVPRLSLWDTYHGLKAVGESVEMISIAPGEDMPEGVFVYANVSPIGVPDPMYFGLR